MTTGLLTRLAAVAALLALTLPAPTVAQETDPTGPATTATPLVAIDRPAPGATTPQRFTVIGWAADPAGRGSGVDAVHVYLDGEAGSGRLLGLATYGAERLDVAQQLGEPRFGLSGYELQVEVPPGAHTLYVYARRGATTGPEQWSLPATVDVVATPAVAAPETGRSLLLGPGCPRAPDGTCLNRPSMPSPTCPQIGPDGQCLPAGPGVPPGWVGAPSVSAAPTPSAAQGFCTQ